MYGFDSEYPGQGYYAEFGSVFKQFYLYGYTEDRGLFHLASQDLSRDKAIDLENKGKLKVIDHEIIQKDRHPVLAIVEIAKKVHRSA